MPNIVQVIARAPWRVSVSFDAAFGGMTTAASYTIVRSDGAQTTVAAKLAFAIDARTIELALTEGLLDGVVYFLTVTGATGSGSFGYQAPAVAPQGGTAADDPVAEALGIDIDWTAPAFDASGDTPTTRGTTCLQDDLTAMALTEPGEIFHRPDRGAGLASMENAPSDPSATLAAVLREWNQDDRVASISNQRAVISTTGTVTVAATVTPIALPDSNVPVKVTNG